MKELSMYERNLREVSDELEAAREGLICDECGRQPLLIHVASTHPLDVVAREGGTCQHTNPHRCTGTIVRVAPAATT